MQSSFARAVRAVRSAARRYARHAAAHYAIFTPAPRLPRRHYATRCHACQFMPARRYARFSLMRQRSERQSASIARRAGVDGASSRAPPPCATPRKQTKRQRASYASLRYATACRQTVVAKNRRALFAKRQRHVQDMVVRCAAESAGAA